MASIHPCKHCNGTTYCSASKDANGKLKLRPACICCIVKAGLDPQGIYDKVICSVCGGRAVIQATAEVRPAKKSSTGLMVVVTVLLSISLVFFLSSIVYYYRQQPRPEDIPERIIDKDSVTSQMTIADVRATVRVGMRKEEVRRELGEPYYIRDAEKEQEVWIYQCKDGKMLITFSNGVVYGRQ
jgi:hypothetical protein